MQIIDSPLGKKTSYLNHYNPQLLFPISRSEKRKEIGIDGALPFFGYDIWNAYEISWIREDACPEVKIAEIIYDCNSEFLIESKSLKLYLNSFNNHVFHDENQVSQTIQNDLRKALNTDVTVNIFSVEDKVSFLDINGIHIDKSYSQNTSSSLIESKEIITEKLYSHLLKSNCPVTGQPDWATIFVKYRGKKINHASLLNYIISLRNLQEFHEQCVEKIFMQILNNCKPEFLEVYARYTRRGGIDINPFRSSKKDPYIPENKRIIRQ